jgi:hypothetical protein
MPFEEHILKKVFLDLSSSVRWKYDLNKIDEILKENGRAVYQLSLHHWELNLVQLVWSQIKQNIFMSSGTSKDSLMKDLILLSVGDWENYVEYIRAVETAM